MRISKLLNKKYLSISLIFLYLSNSLYAAEPVDIWNLESQNNEVSTNDTTKKKKKILENSIYKMQSEKINELQIEEDETLISKKIEIYGLYDPEKNGLTIDMWSNSDGKKILDLFEKIKKINLSNDAKDILDIALLTNSYFPKKNITSDEFLKLKADWLILNNDIKLIENYIFKNVNINQNIDLVKFVVNDYLSNGEIENACNVFFNINEAIINDYLSKFYIYCLLNNNQRDDAQLQFDLKKELGFNDPFFEKKFNFLMGYEIDIDQKISENSILDFHLSHRTNVDFDFQPNEKTSKNIWRYLSSLNLLESVESIDLEDQNKISIIERATHEGNYSERELYDLYKRFQFNINQLLTVNESYKLLSNIEARALVYQGILITTEVSRKLELTKILKDLFLEENIGLAFKDELTLMLKDISLEDVPSNYTSFYNNSFNQEIKELKRIKINNKIIHQSKLLNYFRKDIESKTIEKNLNDLLKKIKNDKKYFISNKDIILVESLKSDGIEVLKKYDNLYNVDNSNMPPDIQDYINNNETGLVLLRLAQVIGQDRLDNIGPETLYFIISALNQLNIDALRNKIILKVLPLKV
ncbi:hypothetical protein OAI92_02180 [Candidatus Pelagibacter sp.]|nr:hypothetical protein [Candidatus Pelagibacter sp.]